MRESMQYNPRNYQLEDYQIDTMKKIIDKNKECNPEGVVFFGDSITEWYDIEKYYPEIRNKYNCGIAGFTSETLLWICDEAVIKFEPKLVVLMIGTNDLGNTVMRSPREIALSVKSLIDIINNNLNNPQVILVSTLPCDEDTHGMKAGIGIRTNEMIKIIFKEYEKVMSDMNNVILINAFDYMIDIETGNIKKQFTRDGLHLTETGYDKYTRAIKETIVSEYARI